MATTIIALKLIGIAEDGTESSIEIKIDAPVQKAANEWACRIVLKGVKGYLRPGICGNDAFQSLCLAVDFIRFMLDDFLQKGGKLLEADTREEWPLEAYSMKVPALLKA